MSSAPAAAAVALRSAPEQNTRPAWVSTITRTASSATAAASPAASSDISCADNALRLGGESRVSVATPRDHGRMHQLGHGPDPRASRVEHCSAVPSRLPDGVPAPADGALPSLPGASSAATRSGSTCTCRSVRRAAATATSPRTRPRSWGRASPRPRTPTPRCWSSGWPGTCWRPRAAGGNRVLRRRYADAAAGRAPRLGAARDRRPVRAGAGRGGDHRGQPGVRHARVPRTAAGGRVHPHLVRDAVGGAARAAHPGPPAHAGPRRWRWWPRRGGPASRTSTWT